MADPRFFDYGMVLMYIISALAQWCRIPLLAEAIVIGVDDRGEHVPRVQISQTRHRLNCRGDLVSRVVRRRDAGAVVSGYPS